VVTSLPTSSAALDLAARTDLVTAVAEQVCRPVWTRLGLLARPFPFAVPSVPVILTWHHRNDTDPAHTWLRAQVRHALRTILGAEPARQGSTPAPAGPSPAGGQGTHQ
jgi:DNA-binding transcriptional LysR family regulator